MWGDYDSRDECGNFLSDSGRDEHGISGDVFHMRWVVKERSVLCQELQACNVKYNQLFSAAGGLGAGLPVTTVFREYMIREIDIEKYLRFVCMQDVLGAKAYSVFCREMPDLWEKYSDEFDAILKSVSTPVSSISDVVSVSEFYSYELSEAMGLKFERPDGLDSGPALLFECDDMSYATYVYGPSWLDVTNHLHSVFITQQQLDDAIAYAETHMWGVDVSDAVGSEFLRSGRRTCECCGRDVSECGPIGLYGKSPYRLEIGRIRRLFGDDSHELDGMWAVCQSCAHKDRHGVDVISDCGRGSALLGCFGYGSEEPPMKPSKEGCRDFSREDYVFASDVNQFSDMMAHGLVMRRGIMGRLRRFYDCICHFRRSDSFRLPDICFWRERCHTYCEFGIFSVPYRVYDFFSGIKDFIMRPFWKRVEKALEYELEQTARYSSGVNYGAADAKLVVETRVLELFSALDGLNERFRSMLVDVPLVYDSGETAVDDKAGWKALRVFAESNPGVIRTLADGLLVNRRLSDLYPAAYAAVMREKEPGFDYFTAAGYAALSDLCRKRSIRIRTEGYVSLHVGEGSSAHDIYCSLETMCIAAGLGSVLGEPKPSVFGGNSVLGILSNFEKRFIKR